MKKQINLRLIAIAILAILATTISITIAYYSLFQKQVRQDLIVSAKLLKDTHFLESVDAADNDIDLSTDIDELRVTWVGADGTVLYDNDTNAMDLSNHADRPEIQKAFEEGVGESVRRSDTMNKNSFYYAVMLDNGTVLRVSTDAENIWFVFVTAAPMILLVICCIILVCIALSGVMTRQMIRPIETMARNIEDTQIEPPYRELVPFANMIRKQHTDILSAAKVRQDFTANVSHELKTPLTAIAGYAELIDNDMVDATQEKHFIKEIRKNADRLLSLINDIIRLSELDRSEAEPCFEMLDLNEVVQECLETLSVNAERRQVKLYFNGEMCRIRGNREMLRELTDNLVQNAIRYNNENGHVWVGVHGGDEKYLSVRDDGIGIPEEDQKRVFERFYRVDKSRSKATGGTGLGLAIVKHIVELHHARIELQSEVGRGTIICVKFT